MERDSKGVIPKLFLPNSNPYGVQFSEWTIRWWQWCLSQPKSTNPASERQRINWNARDNQIYPDVWFLAGTTGGFAERECTIPRERAILCPIINFEISAAEDPNLKSDDDLVSFARADVDKIAKLDVIIDGTRLPDLKKFRVESAPFDVTLPEDNIWGVRAGLTRAAADGYWLFLKPLSSGSHRIQFGGSCLAGTINIGTIYCLTVQ
jgi:hypothetical protein